MNIFFLHPEPHACAVQHCDKHVVKMILEACQMLDSAHWNGQGKQPGYYNHPCSKWTRESQLNYYWHATLAHELQREYSVRFSRVHACFSRIQNLRVCPPPDLPFGEPISTRHENVQLSSPPPLCMPDDCKISNDSLDPIDRVVMSYRLYYIKHKNQFARWQHTEIPSWYARALHL